MKLLEPIYKLELLGLENLQKLPLFSGPFLETFWQVVTKLGDPRWTFILYFPLFYPFMPETALQFLIAGSVSEFVNGIFKWILLGDRPFWYVFEHNMTDISLKQFPVTCETGPGSPSGHVMVTSSVFLCVMMFAKQRGYRRGCVAFYGLLILAISVSRLYILAHFPHQVLLGAFGGIAVGLCCLSAKPSKWKLSQPFILAFCLTISGMLTFYGLRYLNVDPNWTIEKATKWCEKREWIHLSTTPIAALVRDIGALIGLGLALRITVVNGVRCENRVIASGVNILVIFLMNCIPLFQENPLLYYVLKFALNVFRVLLVVVIVPGLVGVKRDKVV